MAQTLELIIKARDEASAKLGTMTSSLTSLKEAMVTGGAAAALYVKAVKELGDLAKDYMEYAIAAGDFAEKTGMAVEEASALLDAVKDLDVNVTSLMMAFRTMSKQGIDPSIEGLIEVKSRLDGAGSDAERLALALKLMGRSGADLIPILAQLDSEALRGLVAGLTDAQRVTEAEYQEMLKLRAEVAAFEDQVETVKLSVGSWAIETFKLNEYLQVLQALLKGIGPYLQALGQFWGVTGTSVGVPGGGGGPPRPTPKGISVPDPGKFGLALGGEVGTGGDAYMVGEHGAERFTPSVPGTISPTRDQLASSIDRMVKTLPTILIDAIERAK